MAKEIIAHIKLQIPAGQANPAPPVGTALGPRGVNIMVPRTDDEKMFSARLRRGVCEMIPVICERTQFVAVVLTCDCENWQPDFLELLTRGQHRIIVSVSRRVLEYALEINRWISHE